MPIELPVNLKGLVDKFGDNLKAARDGNRVTPTAPIAAERLQAVYKKLHTEITVADIVVMVNYLRVERRLPIAGGPEGYYWANDSTELAITVGNFEVWERQINGKSVV